MSYKVKLTCRRFSLFILPLLFVSVCFAQPNFDAVDQLIKQNQKNLGPGFVVLAWKDGKVIYQKQGYADFTPKTQAPIAATGDWMTAALVMTFVDEGKLSLDDKVTKYIPLFGKYMKGYITIRNCLTNTTGIKTDENVEKALQKTKYETLEDMVNTYANKHDIATNPGTEFFYSNLGPNIAGRVLEIISKKTFGRLMMDRIIRPLKMRGLHLSTRKVVLTILPMAAGLPPNDFGNFLMMLLNKGMFDGKQILSEKAVEEMETAQFASTARQIRP